MISAPVKRSIISLLSWTAAWRYGNVSRPCRDLLIALVFLSTLNLQPSTVLAQGTAFMYQGRLNDGGNPASGNYDLRFTIYDSTNIPGIVIAGPLTNSATAVSNGLFAVSLDFGSGVFTGADRWLDIGVRTNPGPPGFTVLVPRQHLTPVPYAIFANTASNVSGSLPAIQLAGTLPASAFAGYTNTVALTNNGNIFGGTFSGAFNGAFSGNGGGVTNVNVANLTGVLADNQLPSNTAFVNSNQTFIGSNNFSGNNLFSGANVFTGTNNFTGPNNFTNRGNSFVGSFFGNGLVGWIPTNGTAIQAVTDTGYLLTNSQLVTVTLPAAPANGDIVRISGAGAGGWRVAQNAGQSIIGNFLSFASSPWTMTQSANTWYCIASSADGSRLAAAAGVNGIYTSINYGTTWNSSSGAPAAQVRSIASSADGSKLVAAVYGGVVYTNTSSGWTGTSSGSANWISVASSANGGILFAAVSGGSLYSSTTAGATWGTIAGSASWISVACSADGSKWAAAISGGGIPVSGGSSDAPSASWVSVASSADGNKLAAANSGGGIYTSTNAGAHWIQQTGAPSVSWASIASSADGSKLVAVVNGGGIYTSSNFGVTWAQQTNAPARSWSSIASSADGTKVAVVINNATVGGIYVSQASSQTTTTVGTTGYIIGGQASAVELQYIGNGQFMPVSSAGTIWAF